MLKSPLTSVHKQIKGFTSVIELISLFHEFSVTTNLLRNRAYKGGPYEMILRNSSRITSV